MSSVKITELDNFGRGITKIDNKICFVDKALPLEECEIEITNEKKSYSEARIKKVIEESKYRIMPICPYYKTCGGCHLMHYDRQSELIYKEEKVYNLIKKIGKLDNVRIKDIAYGNELFYRNKITFHVKNSRIGLFIEKTNDIVEIDECLLVNSIINNIIKKIKDYVKNNPSKLEEIIIKSSSLKETMIVLKGKVNEEEFIKNMSDITSI